MALTHTDITRSNARQILKNIRGKTKAERIDFYRLLALGPMGAALIAIAKIKASANK